MHVQILAWGLTGVILIGLLIFVSLKIWPSARMRRRLRKARDPIVSKARQPAVRFSVKPPKE